MKLRHQATTAQQPPTLAGGGRTGIGPSEDANRALMEQVVEHGDTMAFDQLVVNLRGRLWARAQRLVAPSYVEDLIQETLLRAWSARSTYRGEAAPLTWLLTIMAHEAARDRRLRPSPSQLTTDDLAAITGPDEVPRFEVADAIDRALARLEPRQAALVRLRYLAERDWDSISATLGYDSPRQAQRAFQEAMRRLACLHQVPDPRPPASTGGVPLPPPRRRRTRATRGDRAETDPGPRTPPLGGDNGH